MSASPADASVPPADGPAGFSCFVCGAPAKLQCPKCRETYAGAPAAAGGGGGGAGGWRKAFSVFCSQECFKRVWKEHKREWHASRGSDQYSLQKGWGYAVQRGAARVPAPPPLPFGFAWTGPLRPEKVGPMRSVPTSIPRPDWAEHGRAVQEEQSKWQRTIPVLRSESDLAGIRRACRLARECLDMAAAMVRPGVTTDEIDEAVHRMAVGRGAYPSPLNYYNFPKSCCTSVNEVVCHGIPDLRPLVEGDIVNVDITVYLDGFHGDINETFPVGEIDEDSRRLVQVTYDCLARAIAAVRPGARFRDLGEVISEHARAHGLGVVKTYCGHGIGRLFHCMPNVPHYSRNKAVGVMRPGMVFTIEPMINAGTHKDVMWPDGWTAVTADGRRSAQFEHTMIVTEEGVDVLTRRLESSPPLFCAPPP